MIRLQRPPCPEPEKLEHDYAIPANKEALKQSTYGKCMYCESVIDATGAQVEHIKPKSKYPELTFEWTNLGYTCPDCNGKKYKGDKYDESCPFINPYDEDPQVFITWDGAVLHSDSPRGQYTIKEIGLNRPGLVERRRQKLEKIRKALNTAPFINSTCVRQQTIDAIKAEALPNAEYSAAVKAYLVKVGLV
jgi:uncharacterized protein (TIGR02646 family)